MVIGTDVWSLYTIFDDSDKKRLKRICNEIIRETASAREWPDFPQDALAIGDNGGGDIPILLADSETTRYADAVYCGTTKPETCTRLRMLLKGCRGRLGRVPHPGVSDGSSAPTSLTQEIGVFRILPLSGKITRKGNKQWFKRFHSSGAFLVSVGSLIGETATPARKAWFDSQSEEPLPSRSEDQPLERLNLRVAGMICEVCDIPLSELIAFELAEVRLRRLPPSKQKRLDALMETSNQGRLTASERKELQVLVRDAEEIAALQRAEIGESASFVGFASQRGESLTRQPSSTAWPRPIRSETESNSGPRAVASTAARPNGFVAIGFISITSALRLGKARMRSQTGRWPALRATSRRAIGPPGLIPSPVAR